MTKLGPRRRQCLGLMVVVITTTLATTQVPAPAATANPRFCETASRAYGSSRRSDGAGVFVEARSLGRSVRDSASYAPARVAKAARRIAKAYDALARIDDPARQASQWARWSARYAVAFDRYYGFFETSCTAGPDDAPAPTDRSAGRVRYGTPPPELAAAGHSVLFPFPPGLAIVESSYNVTDNLDALITFQGPVTVTDCTRYLDAVVASGTVPTTRIDLADFSMLDGSNADPLGTVRIIVLCDVTGGEVTVTQESA